jgi:hypothetical protein
VSIEYYKLGGCLPLRLPLTIHAQVSNTNFAMNLPLEGKSLMIRANFLFSAAEAFADWSPY